METPHESERNDRRTGSLNRTMQYGNYTIPAGNGSEEKGLNRTMQYGNYFFSPISMVFSGLNRTMQYGNKKTVKIRKMNTEV